MSARVLSVSLALLSSLPCFADPALHVASLHPLLADLAREVGGTHVDVIELVGKTGDPHRFEPTPADLKRAESATLYLAAGKGLESYLPTLRDIVGTRATILEVGRDLPSLPATDDGDADEHSALDPHWWHSIDLFRRATTTVATAFAAADPPNAAAYQANALAYRARLDDLERWAKREIARIPREKRQLATSHAAFQYFCKDYGFASFPLQGINREQMPAPAHIAKLIAEIKKNHVAAIFPEKESNPSILGALTRDTGVSLGEPLIADGANTPSYEAMVRHNITAIVKALAP
jgi:zinc/manganese transport system substrate-binding protein